MHPESQIYHPGEDKQAGSLQNRYKDHTSKPPFMFSKPCDRLRVTLDKTIQLLFPLCRRFPDPEPDKYPLKKFCRTEDHFWEEHNTKDQDDKDHIQRQSENVEREIVFQIVSQGIMPEDQDPESENNKNEFVYHRHCHQHNSTVRYTIAVFVHIIELHRLSSCGGRRDPGIEKSDKRVLKASPEAVFSVSHGIEQVPDHKPFHADVKQCQSHCGDQVPW